MDHARRNCQRRNVGTGNGHCAGQGQDLGNRELNMKNKMSSGFFRRAPKKLNLLAFFWLSGIAAGLAGEVSLVTLANPLQGTDSSRDFSHGNEYPAIALPFPMNTWAPYTQPQKDSFYYQYNQNKIRGLRQTL